MKKVIGWLLTLMMLFGCAMADQEVSLPGNRYKLTLPDRMEYSPRNPRDAEQSAYFQFAYFSSSLGLEMDVFTYENGGVTLQQLAEAMSARENEVDIRRVNGLEMLCYTGQDDAVSSDGAYYIGYVLMDGDQAIEITFWYANQMGSDKTQEIISSIH